MLNKIDLMGRLVREPEHKATNNGTSVTTFTLAVDRDTADKATDFINCVSWRATADFVAKNCYKGQMVVCSGKVQTRDYEKDGKKVFVTEIVVDHIYPAEWKKKQDGFTEIEDDGNLPF